MKSYAANGTRLWEFVLFMIGKGVVRLVVSDRGLAIVRILYIAPVEREYYPL